MPETKPVDIKAIAIHSLSWGLKALGQDLEALPEEAFDQRFGIKTRSVADFMQEVILTQDHIRLIVTGQQPFDWPDGWIPEAPDGQRSKEAVLKAFHASAEAFLTAIQGFSEAELLEPFESEGRIIDRFERCRFVAWHAAYHSGQVNYIQRMLGDDGWHWN